MIRPRVFGFLAISLGAPRVRPTTAARRAPNSHVSAPRQLDATRRHTLPRPSPRLLVRQKRRQTNAGHTPDDLGQPALA